MSTILQQDRFIVLAGLAGITLLTWGYMVYEAQAMYETGICRCFGMAMGSPDTTAWEMGELLPLFLMWAVMMVAMMTPSTSPMVLTFAAVNRKRREKARPFVPTAIFLLGYLAVWTAFSAVAAVAQWVLHATALLSPMMESTSPLLGGGLLVVAGVFQWTPFKNACLTHCRSPLSFLMTSWREGRRGAFLMGIIHGAYCTGCCWFLMALLFVAGVMNIWWIAILSGLVLLEKILPWGVLTGRIAGIGLCAWGLTILAN